MTLDMSKRKSNFEIKKSKVKVTIRYDRRV